MQGIINPEIIDVFVTSDITAFNNWCILAYVLGYHATM